MEKVIDELPLKATTAQFWGAVKIYTEKPHVINRRMCGVANLWIGMAKESFCWERVVMDLSHQLRSPSANMVKENSQPTTQPSSCNDGTLICSTAENMSSHKEYNEVESRDNLSHQPKSQSADKQKKSQHVTLSSSSKDSTMIYSEKTSENTSSHNESCEAEYENNLVERIKTVLCNEGFTSLESELDNLDNGVHEQEETMQQDLCEVALLSKYADLSKKKNIPWQYMLEEKTSGIAVIRKMIPKQLERYTSAYEVVIMERTTPRVTYLGYIPASAPSIIPRLHYTFTPTNNGVALSCVIGKDERTSSLLRDDPSIVWVQKKLLPKIAKWMTEVMEDGKVEDKGSLKLVDVQEYGQLYQKLKTKYGKQLIKMWPEVTDPFKFVYEDIAIATYLLLLWRQERAEKHLPQFQSFVDLGCGNGLLVYLLNSEGHPGIGIDIKKRSIWSMFPATVHLKEGIIEPSDKNLFPEYNWLIGNHSDELTPWLPVIAAKSKYTTRFFVIPCCAYDFNCKYKRKYAGRSQYSDYLEYVKEIGVVCGFEVWQDKLRIPSTKRVCLIGQNRTYGEEQLSKVLAGIDSFVKKREKLNSEATGNQEISHKEQGKKLQQGEKLNSEATAKQAFDYKKQSEKLNSKGTEEQEIRCKEHCEDKQFGDGLWVNFKAREAVQQVRNCTQLEKSVREDLISTVAKMLMDKKHIVEVEVEQNCLVEWDKGGSMTLGDIARNMEPQQRLALKKEYGGLQTLLKNHRHMFSLIDGKVSLQSPVPVWKTKIPSDRIKTKLCWFHENHKRGCPLPSDLCTFAHGSVDLR